MLTRLRVKGFKNLVDTEVHFGPFTCVAGGNAVGKSNLFDAIRFLSLLAGGKLDEAARSIRAEGGKNGDIKSLFTSPALPDQPLVMEFDLDMIVPPSAEDHLRQEAEASATYLNYHLELRYRSGDNARRKAGELEICSESLTYISKTKAAGRLAFPTSRAWLDSVIRGKKTSALISTRADEGPAVVILHMDGKSENQLHKRGASYKRHAEQLPRTFVSAADADSPTVLCAKAEMQSWEMIQLEPSAMRESDPSHHPPGISPTGAHMAATLYDLARAPLANGRMDPEATYQQVGNRLAELLGGVGQVRVDEDDKRELLTLEFVDRSGHVTPARSLSDGTLSFIALVLKQMEGSRPRVMCMEEPENGIHPRRIPAMLELLQEIAVNPLDAVDGANPLRQVIINTHSPAVVQQVPADSLLIAEVRPCADGNGVALPSLRLSALEGTWRADKLGYPSTAPGSLLAYVKPAAPTKSGGPAPSRVIDRDDTRQLLLNL